MKNKKINSYNTSSDPLATQAVWITTEQTTTTKTPWRPATQGESKRGASPRGRKSVVYRFNTKHYEILCREFLKHLTHLGYSKTSQNTHPQHVREFLSYCEQQGVTRIEDILPLHIQSHYQYLEQRPCRGRSGNLSSMSLAQHLYAIRLLLDYLQETGQLTKNPISGLVFPRPYSRVREVLSQDEIKELYKSAHSARDRAVLSLFYGCGLRRSEAEKLNIRDIHFKTQLLYVREGKGMKRRVIPLTGVIAQDLKDYCLGQRSEYLSGQYICSKEARIDADNAFLLNNRGTRMKGVSALRHLNCIVRRTGIEKEICLHSLRHCIATHLLENGTSIDYVRKFLGHEFLDTTRIYTRVSNEQLKNIHEHRKLSTAALPD
jgi:integrase/recombinase XerD